MIIEHILYIIFTGTKKITIIHIIILLLGFIVFFSLSIIDPVKTNIFYCIIILIII